MVEVRFFTRRVVGVVVGEVDDTAEEQKGLARDKCKYWESGNDMMMREEVVDSESWLWKKLGLHHILRQCQILSRKRKEEESVGWAKFHVKLSHVKRRAISF